MVPRVTQEADFELSRGSPVFTARCLAHRTHNLQPITLKTYEHTVILVTPHPMREAEGRASVSLQHGLEG